MQWIWTIFAVCIFHQFVLRKCETVEELHSDEDKAGSEENVDSDDNAHIDDKAESEPDNEDTKEERGDYSSEETEESDIEDKEETQYKGDDDKKDSNHNNKKKRGLDKEQYEVEKWFGDPADTFGTNQHHYYPTEYKDFGRRFILLYPYKDKDVLQHDVLRKDGVEAEQILDNVAEKSPKKSYTKEDLKLLPVKASPELVLRVAIKSALEQANHPLEPLDVQEKDILRSGDYWDTVRVEEVNPEMVLRTFQKKTGYKLGDEKVNSMPPLNGIKTNIMPGSKLYELVSVLKKSSPRLLYVINDNNNELKY